MGTDFISKRPADSSTKGPNYTQTGSGDQMQEDIRRQIELRRKFADHNDSGREAVQPTVEDRARLVRAIQDQRRIDELEAKLREAEAVANTSHKQRHELISIISQMKSQIATFTQRVEHLEQDCAHLKHRSAADRDELHRLKGIPGIDAIQVAAEALFDQAPKASLDIVRDVARNCVVDAADQLHAIRKKLRVSVLVALGRADSTGVLLRTPEAADADIEQVIHIMINNLSMTDRDGRFEHKH